MDDRNIGVFTSGLVPIRPKNVDPDLPIDGTGREEWRGFVSFKNHPQGMDPPNGEIINWNNRLLRHGHAPSARGAKMLALPQQWNRLGGSQLDRTCNGQITAPGAAVLDTTFPLLARAWASAVSGPKLQAQLARVVQIYEYPNNVTGTGDQEFGWHIWMQKDLRAVLGEHVRGSFTVRYCGAGKLRRCSKLLWKAIDTADNQLAATQGQNPANWRQSATAEEIKFVPGLLSYTMRYTNRPTGIQQVLSFFGHPQNKGR